MYNRLHECLLFLPDLEVGERLNDRDPTPTGGQQERAMLLRYPPDHLPGVDLEIADRNHVLGELYAHGTLHSTC